MDSSTPPDRLRPGVVFRYGALFSLGAPPLVTQFGNLVDDLPGYLSRLQDRSSRFRELNDRYNISDQLQGLVGTLPSRLGSGVLSLPGRVFGAGFKNPTPGGGHRRHRRPVLDRAVAHHRAGRRLLRRLPAARELPDRPPGAEDHGRAGGGRRADRRPGRRDRPRPGRGPDGHPGGGRLQRPAQRAPAGPRERRRRRGRGHRGRRGRRPARPRTRGQGVGTARSRLTRVSRTIACVQARGATERGAPSSRPTRSGKAPRAVRWPSSQARRASAAARSPEAMAARANEAVAGVQGSLPSQGRPGTAPPATVSRRQVVLTARPTAGSGGPNGGGPPGPAPARPPPPRGRP